jgi:hypothetical protein
MIPFDANGASASVSASGLSLALAEEHAPTATGV